MKATLKNIIASRRAVYPNQFNEQPISDSEIKTLLEMANWAPTHKRTEPWRFKVIRGTALKNLGEFLATTYKATSDNFSERKFEKIPLKMKQSAAVIAICMQRDAKESVPEWEEIAAVAMAVQNMWLMAHEMKIGAYWSSPATIHYMHEFFDFKKGERCLGFFYLGKYDQISNEGARQSSIAEKTRWFN